MIILTICALWLIAAIPAALIIGASIKLADQHEQQR